MLENYSRVRLLTDKYQSQGASCFDIGYVIEVYPGSEYEVEFSDANGITTAQIVANEEEIQIAQSPLALPSPEMSLDQ